MGEHEIKARSEWSSRSFVRSFIRVRALHRTHRSLSQLPLLPPPLLPLRMLFGGEEGGGRRSSRSCRGVQWGSLVDETARQVMA